MKRILLIQSGLFGEDGASVQIADSLVERIRAENPDSEVTRLDLAALDLPHLGAAEFASWSVPDDERSGDQRRMAALSDDMIDQLLAHDTLVLAVPMYNLGIPSTLKAWIDRVSRAGKTFRYTSEGPQGMLEGMQAYLVFARGGIYRDTPLDTQTAYLESVLGLMGVKAIDTIYAEGLNMGGGQREQSLEGAISRAKELAMNSTVEVNHAAA